MRGMAREYAAGNARGPGWREFEGTLGQLQAGRSTLRPPMTRIPARLVASVVLPVPPFSASSATIILPPQSQCAIARYATVTYHIVIRHTVGLEVRKLWIAAASEHPLRNSSAGDPCQAVAERLTRQGRNGGRAQARVGEV